MMDSVGLVWRTIDGLLYDPLLQHPDLILDLRTLRIQRVDEWVILVVDLVQRSGGACARGA